MPGSDKDGDAMDIDKVEEKDKVGASGSEGNVDLSGANSTTQITQVTIDSSTAACPPPAPSAAPKQSFSARVRGGSKNKTWKVTLPTALFLEGCHEPRPSSSATIFLKTHYATEDEQTLKYVPYFGDDDKDDVVSDLYNLEDREKQMEFGPEYQERDTNDIIDETLALIRKRLQQNGFLQAKPTDKSAWSKQQDLQTRINDVLADHMDEYRTRVTERYELAISKRNNSSNDGATTTTNSANVTASTGGNDTSDNTKEASGDADASASTAVVTATPNSKEKATPFPSEPSPSVSPATKKLKTGGERHSKKLDNYLDAMDTYRPLFCRRCFIYDCNMHGNLSKPSLELQGEIAVQKEREGFWVDEVSTIGDQSS